MNKNIKLLLVDNDDSFTYNLAHRLVFLGAKVDTVRSSTLSFDNINSYDAIVLSPGPGLPKDFKKMRQLITRYILKKPFLGVCLGHQAIAEHFGGTLVNLPVVYHGVSSEITMIKKSVLFSKLPSNIFVGRYHSWVVGREYFPNQFIISAIDEENNIMAFEHSTLPIFGVQFHPESIMTTFGDKILNNFLDAIDLYL